MNCDNRTGPVDIKHDSTTLTCDLKCSFSYKYVISGVVATNKKSYLSLKLRDGESQTVTYTSNKGIGLCNKYGSGGGNYSVNEIRLYSPSLHTYSGIHADAELLIYHNNIVGGKNLLVCVPISTTLGTSNDASKQLTEIINYMSKMGNSQDESDNIKGVNFNLNNFIPNDYYYTYTATLPYYPCYNCIDYIVFNIGNGIINISPATLKKLNNIISKNELTTKEINSTLEFTYSKKKPKYGSSDPDKNIYIECNPTGADGEVLIDEPKDKFLDSLSMSFISSTNNFSQYVYDFLYIVVFFVVIFGVIFLFKFLGKLYNCHSDKSCKSSSGGNSTTNGGGKKGYSKSQRGGNSINRINKTNLKL